MRINKFERARRLFAAIGQIGDKFIDEATKKETKTEVNKAKPKSRRRAVAYGAVGAAASIGVIASVLVFRSRSIKKRSVLQETA